jgi:hypothetical protein
MWFWFKLERQLIPNFQENIKLMSLNEQLILPTAQGQQKPYFVFSNYISVIHGSLFSALL